MALAERTIALATANSSPSEHSVAVDKIGYGIITIMKQSAQTVRETADRVADTVRRLAEDLHQTEEQGRRLEGELKQFQDRTVRAEKWLARIQSETAEEFQKLQDATKLVDAVLQDRSLSNDLQ